MSFSDGVTSRSVMTRLESYLIVANTATTNAATEINGKALSPSMLTRTFFPWKDETVALTSNLPLTSIAGPTAFTMNFGLRGMTGANVTSIAAAINPSYLLQPSAYPGYMLINATSSSEAPVLPFTTTTPFASKCTIKSSWDAGSQGCSATLDPTKVPLDCTFNPCSGGLCDGQHSLSICTHSFVEQSNIMFVDLPPDGKVGAGTLTSCVVSPITTSNGINKDSTCTSAVSSANARVAGDSSSVELPPEALKAFTGSFSHRTAARIGGGLNMANALHRAESAMLGRLSKAKLVVARAKVAAPPADDADDDAARALVFK